MARVYTTTRVLQYFFTESELKEFAENLAEQCSLQIETENQKKAVVSQFKASLDEIAAKIAKVATNLRQGYVYRDTPCSVTYDSPIGGQKTITRKDTGEIIDVVPMSDDEMQEELYSPEEFNDTAPEELGNVKSPQNVPVENLQKAIDAAIEDGGGWVNGIWYDDEYPNGLDTSQMISEKSEDSQPE